MDVVFPPTMPHSQVRRSLAMILAVQLNAQANPPTSSAQAVLEVAKKISAYIAERDADKE